MTDKARRSASAAAVLALFAADQISKCAARSLEARHWPLPGLFEFTFHENHGLIANLPVPLFLILAVTLTIVAAITHKLFISAKRTMGGETWALVLVLGGALGNSADRLRLGYVHDWAMFFGTSIINLADAFISIGLVWYILLLRRRAAPED